ncbi:hypothetical protein [Pseudonocardia sp.]|jgi:hypothetical protein|uniref:hypothetical protein n=1 Tax=Pseudonocardia sp. TaxID=60912 RepID=UPI00260AEA13|nr:hypothetical protein [Pseudonocardia sp.]MCW2719268.1 hypothetical protein [Pseudonocardia sp.]MDT7613521.1 hypothetical protein [Pseudonocardiales bacterium]
MTPTPMPHTDRPTGHRLVPLLAEHDLGHYPEFRTFLGTIFGLDDDPFGPPGLLRVGDRIYEFTFVGRSGRPFPDGTEIGALVPGLEPLDETAADRDLWAILAWLVDGVGGEWNSDALATTGRIYRIPATEETS